MPAKKKEFNTKHRWGHTGLELYRKDIQEVFVDHNSKFFNLLKQDGGFHVLDAEMDQLIINIS